MVSYAFNEEARKLAKRIIRKHHGHLEKLVIVHVFQDKGKSKKPVKGKREWARASKVPERFRFMMDRQPVFMITYNKQIWKGIDEKKKKALVDHELAHCGFNAEKGRPYMIDHDLEEFKAILKRHGLWTDGVKDFVESARRHK